MCRGFPQPIHLACGANVPESMLPGGAAYRIAHVGAAGVSAVGRMGVARQDNVKERKESWKADSLTFIALLVYHY